MQPAGAYDRVERVQWDGAIDAADLRLGGAPAGDVPQAAVPERRLLLAVLVDAIVCVRRVAAAPSNAARRARAEAERWMRSNDRGWPFSFVNVCEALDIAHGPLRRAVLHAPPHAAGTRGSTRRGLLPGEAEARRRQRPLAAGRGG